MIELWLKLSAAIFVAMLLIWLVGTLIGEMTAASEGDGRAHSATPPQLRAHQARRDLDVARERIRLQVEVTHHLRQLDTEIEQELRRRSGRSQ